MSTIEHILFKDLSHLQAICEHPNANITMIPAGEEYSGFNRIVYPSCEVDKVKPKWWQSSLLHDEEYVAKEDRWMDYESIGTMEDMTDAWNNHIKFVEDPQDGIVRALSKAQVIFHFLDGSKKTVWFESDNEMNNYLTNTIQRGNFNEILFIDGEETATRMTD